MGEKIMKKVELINTKYGLGTIKEKHSGYLLIQVGALIFRLTINELKDKYFYI
jgi:hypothetical protein